MENDLNLDDIPEASEEDLKSINLDDVPEASQDDLNSLNLDDIPEESGPSFSQMLEEAGGTVFNPLGKAIEVGNKIPYLQDVIPDVAETVTAPNVDIGEGVAGGLYSAARNTAQLGADIQDAILPGESTPMSDMLSVVPKYEASGTTQNVVSNITEIASGFALGNKASALAKASGYSKPVIEAVSKAVPKVQNAVLKGLWDIFKGGAQGVAGTTVTTAPGSSNLVVGEDALIKKLGMDEWVTGLPTDSDDAAYNALAARVNTALDAFITGSGISAGFKGIRALHDTFGKPIIMDKLDVIWSQNARAREIFKAFGEEFVKIKGVMDEGKLQQVYDRLLELTSNKSATHFERPSGIQGVDDINVKLDATGMVENQLNKNSDSVDIGIKNALNARTKRLANKGYEETAFRRAEPLQQTKKMFEQTEEVLGGPKVADEGETAIQKLGKDKVTETKTKQMLEQNKLVDTGNKITENVEQAKDIRNIQKNELYEKVPSDAKADQVSLSKILKEEKDNMPVEITNLLKSKENDGSFKFLNNVLRPEVNRLISKLDGATGKAERTEIAALKRLRNNIDEDQITHLETQGRTDVIDAAKKAKDYYETEIAQNQQGVVGEIQKSLKKHGLNREDAFVESRGKLEKAIGNWKAPEHERRLWDVLASDEGNRSESLIERYKNSKDKIAELDKIEDEVYGDILRNFFDRQGYKPATGGYNNFKELMEDPQGLSRVREMVKMANDAKDTSVKQALKYSYVRNLREKIETGYLTELGTEKASVPEVRKIINDDNLIKTGKEVFEDTPEYMEAVKDVLTIAHDIQRSNYLKASAAEGASRVSERAEKGLRTILGPIYGPLNHRSLQIRTLFGAILEMVKPEGIMGFMEDKMLANPELIAHYYQMATKQGTTLKNLETIDKVLVNTLFHTNGEREQFNKKRKKIETELQTEDALKKDK